MCLDTEYAENGEPVNNLSASLILGFNAASGVDVYALANRHKADLHGHDPKTGWRSIIVPWKEAKAFVADAQSVDGITDIHGRHRFEGRVELPVFLKNHGLRF